MITTNSSSIRVKLGAAITTSEMAITGHYVTMSVSGVVSNVVQINMLTNGVTEVEVVPSSSVGGVVNVLKNLQIANVDTVANQVIIEQWDGLTAKSMCPAITLDVTQSIQINSDGDLTVIPVAGGGGGGSGTVTSVHGTGTVSGITLTGTVTTAGNLTLGGTLAVTPSNFASQAANTFLAAPNGAAGVPTFRTMVAADVPTLNQNTTGNAATATLASTVTTNANLTGDVTSVGNATTLTNAPVIAKVLTGYTAGAGTIASTDSILQAFQKVGGLVDNAAWSTWSPTITGLTLGNGTLTAKYKQIGKTVFFSIDITAGSTTSITAALNIPFPVTPVARPAWSNMNSSCGFFDTSAGILYTGVGIVSNTNTINPAVHSVTGTLIKSQGITSTSPVVIATGDSISLIGIYEAS